MPRCMMPNVRVFAMVDCLATNTEGCAAVCGAVPWIK
ncbi:hypothetical protein CBM2634_A80189 [Cupriavidus taiwanensis]|uniref:Uncharacterized protein n=1 Tax=Cupriavidus taiwanensis TaxID=164546 RepID=A0A375J2D0_9BURK|nr:hypothetical protein CBM2634_A80189 [Cupriavidus taiwanensis]